MYDSPKYEILEVSYEWNQLHRYPLFCAPGLVRFVPAVARLLFCPALPGSFLTMFAQNKEDLCIYSPSFSGRRPLYCRYSPLQLLVSETFQFPLVPVPVALLPQLPSQTRHHRTVVKLVLGRRGPDRRRLLLPLFPLLILPRIVADGQMPQITEQVILRNRVRRSCLSIPSVTHSFGKWAFDTLY